MKNSDHTYDAATGLLLKTRVTTDAGKAAGVQPCKHGGKELDAMYGLYWSDFGARHLSHQAACWTTMDPFCEKYYHPSPYLYCANNPFNLIDPDGRDIFEIDQHGVLVNRIVDKLKDQFRLVDQNGEQVKDDDGNDLTLEFEYGTVESQRTIKTGKDTTYEVYQIRGDENGTKLFEFLSDNLSTEPRNVEFSHIMTGIEGNEGLNFVNSGHTRGSEPGMSGLYIGQLQYGYTIREMIHSHPKQNGFSESDSRFFNQITKYSHEKKTLVPLFKVYHVPTKNYIKY